MRRAFRSLGMCAEPPLFTLLTHDCTPSHNSNLFIKFADDTTVVGLISNRMRQTTGARWATWPGGAGTTISLWMWRRRRRLLLTSGECTLSMLLWPSTWLWRERAAPSSWVCTSQRTSPGLTTLRTGQESTAASLLPPQTQKSQSPDPHHVHLLQRHHREHPTSCITVWYGACNASCRKSLQRIVRAAEKIVGVSPTLPPGHLQHPSHPQSPQHCRWSHPPVTQLLQSAAIREELRLQARTSRLKDSFIHQAVRKLNSLPSLPPPLLPHATLNSDTTTPRPPHSQHPQDLPPLTNCDPTSHFVQHWTDLYLIQHWL